VLSGAAAITMRALLGLRLLTLALLALAASAKTLRYIPQPPTPQMASADRVVGSLKMMIDTQVAEYNSEVDRWAREKASMSKVIEKAMDNEAQRSASEMKANMKESHDKKLHAIAGMIAGIDSALMTLRPEKDWKLQHEKEAEDVEAIYADYPELKPSEKVSAAAAAAFIATKGKVLGKQEAVKDAMDILEIVRLESKHLGILLPPGI